MILKIAIILLSTILISNVAFAQKISAKKVPAVVISAFKSKFPNTTKVSWEIENTNEYEAEFKINKEEISANYDSTGTWLETETEIEVTALPKTILKALKKDFWGYKIMEASKIESVKDGICYEAEIEKEKEKLDVIYTAEGKVISKEALEKEK